MEYRGEVEIDGEKTVFVSLSDEEWNQALEATCGTARITEGDAACEFGTDDESVSFDSITPEDIIGPRVFDRDWTERLPREKPVWHFHVRFADLPLVCARVHDDTEDEAANEAVGQALARLGEAVMDAVEGEEGDDDYEAAYAWSSHFEGENGAVSYCVHGAGESCPGGCAKVTVTHA